MRALFTADWQTEWDNLAMCEGAKDEVFSICDKYDLNLIVVAGDLKRQYNPVDIRVARFWTSMIHYAHLRNLKVAINLGNHDRIGLYADAENWLSVLLHAGAKVFDHPGSVYTGTNSYKSKVCFLPYSSSVETTRQSALYLAENSDKKSDVLVFHDDLRNTAYNVLGHKSEGRLRMKDLKPHRYLACIGGHIHMHLKLGDNVYYVGSPFVTDWGEANQRKGYLIVQDRKVKFVRSELPGWYDPSWPDFKKPQTWRGTRVRVHAECRPGQSHSVVVEEAQQQAEKKYRGAQISVVTDFVEEKVKEVTLEAGSTDLAKIKAYVEHTLPTPLRDRQEQIVAYLRHRLAKVSPQTLRRRKGVKFLSASAKNFLSFESLEIDYDEVGSVVVVGENQDWLARSNGAGKTNFLQAIPVALFGSTFKAQKHDAWARRDVDEPAEVCLKLKDERGRLICVTRGRKPSLLKLEVDTKDQSSGFQGTKTGTQGLIEQVSGFTWSTLANAVYIDQQVTSTFLIGTPSARKEILSKFQNLERFTDALQEVKKDVGLVKKEQEAVSTDVHQARCIFSECKDALHKVPKDASARVKVLKRRLTEASDIAWRMKRKVKESKVKDSVWEKIERVRKIAEKKEKLTIQASTEVRVLADHLSRWRNLLSQERCPECEQPLPSFKLKVKVDVAEIRVEKAAKQCRLLSDAATELQDKVKRLRAKADKREQHHRHCKVDLRLAKEKAESLGEQYYVARTAARKEKAFVVRLQRRVEKAKKRIAYCKEHLHVLSSQEMPFLEYCAEAFSRNGIPAFLNVHLCPVLNNAAEEYSELFADKEVQVLFQVVDGEFEVSVMNAHGGDGFDAQSAGEKKLAGIITSFALREAAPKCNVLILDEPGDGLDAANARRFATGLKKLSKRFSSIFVITHNPNIIGELGDAKVVTVTKRKGVSAVLPHM